jgi:SAM-dependent methyltransferase
MMRSHLDGLYHDAMARAYATAFAHLNAALARNADATLLELGAYDGGFIDDPRHHFRNRNHYKGLEWNAQAVQAAQTAGRNVRQADLNKPLPLEDASMDIVVALSVIEHLLNPCLCIHEAWRVLKPQGTLVMLTPNISTYFTMLQLLLGRMPSSGPHPDSSQLQQMNALYDVKKHTSNFASGDTPTHRHLVVFSYRSLKALLESLAPAQLKADAFGYYPFPAPLNRAMEALDPTHCHQMVFAAIKP